MKKVEPLKCQMQIIRQSLKGRASQQIAIMFYSNYFIAATSRYSVAFL